MIIVSLTCCPPRLKGDLSKWLLEINTGVYVGQVSARVRDSLWKRICDNVGDGQATMVFNTNNEQHYDFYVHNTSWLPVDYDGIKLMKHPNKSKMIKDGFNNDVKMLMTKRKRRKTNKESYILLDIETTGLSCEEDSIIEIGIVEVEKGIIIEKTGWLIITKEIPNEITKLTGIDKKLISDKGLDLKEVLPQLFEKIDDKSVLMYNSDFDLSFLKKNTENLGLEFPDIIEIDVLKMVRKKIKDLDNYKLINVIKHMGIQKQQTHRAISDCLLVNEVYIKLKEM
jgi:CRISPR-associated protein Cas2